VLKLVLCRGARKELEFFKSNSNVLVCIIAVVIPLTFNFCVIDQQLKEDHLQILDNETKFVYSKIFVWLYLICNIYLAGKLLNIKAYIFFRKIHAVLLEVTFLKLKEK
jgi:hypothetical protein